MDIPLDRSSEDNKSRSAEQRGELPGAAELKKRSLPATGIKYVIAVFRSRPGGLTVGMMVLHSSPKLLE
jgi:hypothetical protein